MPGRKYQASPASNYRYSINGQEKDIELNENITAAEFWEYDSRAVRRWNVDPKTNISMSPYSCFTNNPIATSDTRGDTTEIRNSKGEVLGTNWGKKTGNNILILNEKNDKKWETWRKNNFKDLKEFIKTEQDFIKLAVQDGNVYDINSAKSFYSKYTGNGSVDKIFDAPISKMTDIVINSKKANQSVLLALIKKEKLGPEWYGSWRPNQSGIMQIQDISTENDLTKAPTGPHLAHLHPKTSQHYVITYKYIKQAGFAELAPYSPVDLNDIWEAQKHADAQPSERWNTVIDKNSIWFYDGRFTFDIKLK